MECARQKGFQLNPLLPNHSLFMSSSDAIDTQELERLQNMMRHEDAAFQLGFKAIAGIDEAGRGPLAGPVVAAVCLLPQGALIAQVNDSKKLNAKRRRELFERLVADPSIRYGIGVIASEEIDQINIYQATLKAMFKAIDQLKDPPDYLLVDGIKLCHPSIPSKKIIRGDQLSQSIAAASIIAKETRDRMMCKFDEQWPEYAFARHKGYGTALHLQALAKYGPCPIHRLSFRPLSC